MTYKEFRKAVNFLFPLGGTAEFFCVYDADTLQFKPAVKVDCLEGDEDTAVFRAKVDYKVLKELDEREEE